MPDIKQPWEYERAIAVLHAEVIEGFRADNPVLGEIKTTRTRHGGSARIDTETGPLILPPHEAEVKYLLKNEVMDSMDLIGYQDMLAEIGRQLAQTGERMLFETLDAVTEATLSTVDWKGEAISHDTILDVIEKFPPKFFNEKGELGEGFILYIHPDIAGDIAQMAQTPEQKKRAEEIKNKKLEEKNAQKRTRRIS